MRDESFTRWQAITQGQLTVTLNLFLGLAVASLGFSLNLLKDEKLILGCWGRAFLAVCLASFSCSVGFGSWCSVNRLLDFRKTKDIARDREKPQESGKSNEEIEELEIDRAWVRRAGKRTWRILWFQIGSFLLGVLTLIGCLLSVYSHKLA